MNEERTGQRYGSGGVFEMYCVSCGKWKPQDMFDESSTRHPNQRKCNTCRERLQDTQRQRLTRFFSTMDKDRVSRALWGKYLRPVFFPPGSKKRGRIASVRSRAINVIMEGDRTLSKKYQEPLVRAVRDGKIHPRVAVWLTLRKGVFDKDFLRAVAAEFVDRCVFASPLGGNETLVEVAREVVSRVKDSVDRPNGPNATSSGWRQVADLAAIIPVRMAGVDVDNTMAWRSAHAVTALVQRESMQAARETAMAMFDILRGELELTAADAFRNIRDVSVNHAQKMYDEDGKRILNIVQQAAAEEEAKKPTPAKKKRRRKQDSQKRLADVVLQEMGWQDPLKGTLWIEVERADDPRYLQVTEATGSFVLLRCFHSSNEEEVGDEMEIERAEFVPDTATGTFAQVFPEDIIDQGIEVPHGQEIREA